MEEYRNDRISYDEGWQKISTEELYKPAEEDTTDDAQKNSKPQKKEKKKRSFPALISIQLVICVVIIATLFFLKISGSSVYSQLSDYYHDMCKVVLVDNSAFENFDLSGYFSEKSEKSAATPDEV